MAKPLFLIILAGTTPWTILFLCSVNYYTDYVKHLFASDASKEVYDFIIVGSGSSGAVVALRLSQNYKVLLLEAGGDPILLNTIPGFALDLLEYPGYDWQYKSVPQTLSGFGFENNQIVANRGKVLGGSSVLNYMMYLRGNPLDYDNWANITGDPEWKYDNILPYFKKSIKDYRGNYKTNKKNYESSPYGFLTIESMNWTPMLEYFKRAAGEMGFAHGIDANGPQKPGFGQIELTQNHGKRMSTNEAILQNLFNNKNIRILKYAQATKIKFDKYGNAIGVSYSHHGSKKFAVASKEVVLSAGSFDSPKLLMLSGIGPKAELEKIKIKSRVDLPVGKNLQDHACSFIFPALINTSVSLMLERDFGPGALYDYFVNGKGLLTAPNGIDYQGFFSTSQTQEESGGKWPNIQMLFFPIAPSQMFKDSITRALHIKPHISAELLDPYNGQDGFALLPILVRPKSRGQVTLKDKNPFSDQLIDHQLLSNPEDLKTMVEAFRFGIKMIEESKALQEIGTKFGTTSLTECKAHKFRSDAYWECHLRHLLGTVWHPVGTCAMGKKGDKGSVLDSKLRVFGVRGLRVIDASIMPVIVNANTNAPSIMIGEKGADMILEYWAKQTLVCTKLDIFKISTQNQCYYS